ncbi:carotenoid biosynthesis protein, partial [bacterium]|nr:carotenoid biosynthesis protein [bacterium]
NSVISAVLGASLMTGLDVILEVSAPRFDFWEFENGIIPIQNYIGWFVTAFIAHLGYQYFKVETHKVISWHVLLSIIIFFAIFLFV